MRCVNQGRVPAVSGKRHGKPGSRRFTVRPLCILKHQLVSNGTRGGGGGLRGNVLTMKMSKEAGIWRKLTKPHWQSCVFFWALKFHFNRSVNGGVKVFVKKTEIVFPLLFPFSHQSRNNRRCLKLSRTQKQAKAYSMGRVFSLTSQFFVDSTNLNTCKECLGTFPTLFPYRKSGISWVFLSF